MAIESVDPATGERLQRFEPLTSAALENKLEVAHRASCVWRETPLDERASVLRRAADFLDGRRADYGRLMTREMGKPLAAAKDEAAKCATALRYYADHAAAFLADEPVASDGEQGYVAFQPLGVVLAVMPWNFRSGR